MLLHLAQLDQRGFCLLLYWGRKYHLTPWALRLSASGNGPAYLYMAVLLLVLTPDGQHLFNLLLAGFLLELPCYLLLKNTIRRIRPCHSLPVGWAADFEPSDRYSLPSGHTAGAFVFAGALSQVYPPLAPLVYGWALLVGSSRIVLGVHYPLDIVAGMALGSGASYWAGQMLAQ